MPNFITWMGAVWLADIEYKHYHGECHGVAGFTEFTMGGRNRLSQNGVVRQDFKGWNLYDDPIQCQVVFLAFAFFPEVAVVDSGNLSLPDGFQSPLGLDTGRLGDIWMVWIEEFPGHLGPSSAPGAGLFPLKYARPCNGQPECLEAVCYRHRRCSVWEQMDSWITLEDLEEQSQFLF